MTTMAAHPAQRLHDTGPIRGVLAIGKGLALATTAAAIGLGLSSSRTFDAALGVGSVALAAWVGVAVLAMARSKPPTHLGLYVMACSSARMIAALGFGVLLFFAWPAFAGRDLAGLSFWMSFLITALGVLALETVLVRSAIRRLSDSTPASPPIARE